METYYGHIRTLADTIILFEACRIGLLARVQRRLSEKERQSIRSGSVFVWDEQEAGLRRWTDGKLWSASRVSGNFLTYREMEGKRGDGSVSQSLASGEVKTLEITLGSYEEQGAGMDECPAGYQYKPDGLIKQSFSITTSAGRHLHLISYYSRSHPSTASLQQPTTDPVLRHIRPQIGLYPESIVNDHHTLLTVARGTVTETAYPISPHPIDTSSRTTQCLQYNESYVWSPDPPPTSPKVAVPYPDAATDVAPVSVSSPPPYDQPQHYTPPLQQPHSPALPPSLLGLTDHYVRPTQPESALHPTGSYSCPSAYPGRYPQSIHETWHEEQNLQAYEAAADPRIASTKVAPSPILQVSGAARSPHLPKQTPEGDIQQPDTIGVSPKPEVGNVHGIGSWMNGTLLAPIISSAGPISGSGRLPGAQDPCISEGPRDIPYEKIEFAGEDKRALRQLDRGFAA